MLTRLKRFALSTVIFFLAALSFGYAICLWYRLRDHSPALFAEHRPLAKVAELQAELDSTGLAESAFSLTDDRGHRTAVILQRPAAAAEPLPAVLILGGQYTGARAVRLVRLGRAALLCAMDYPAVPTGKITPTRVPRLLFRLDHAARDAVGMSFSVLDFLCARADVDTSRITVLGASFGVPFAIIASLDPRVKATVLIQGAAGLEEVIDWNLRKRIRFTVLRKPVSFLLGTLTAPYEPASYIGRLAPRPVLLINSRQDEKIPAACAEELYSRSKPPKERLWIDSPHLHPSRSGLIDSLSATVSDWLVSKDLL
ncbi:MAG: hypothetical protein A3F83_06735 [Candidatus Glassbacteria bacterium RIFCSPLOWO2_12_FULL_58_11]|uniref:Peptidase S9 prolyl oligopeptidase catalytic domain-containing protein n=1 Tax=Candidatus Glassbacteria bacterium RIFCSPLOWO2_12_FULL_58_11 TaxID=1817867 RepID=A0A1F5YWZ7_9BACT|nr:MAG: hypothetical protein A3F83_06735 [Candidatus Glassbacteria bacterium RIFCSPLOWO2_12_FULL_58_11]